jgi:hypothetical protein
MGCAVRRIAPEVEFIHPAFQYVPVECIWLRLEERYLRRECMKREAMKTCWRSVIIESLRDSVHPRLGVEITCSGRCGVEQSR